MSPQPRRLSWTTATCPSRGLQETQHFDQPWPPSLPLPRLSRVTLVRLPFFASAIPNLRRKISAMGGGGVIRTAARTAIGGSCCSVPLAGCWKPSPASVAPSPLGEARCPSMSWSPQNAHVEAAVAQQPSPDIDDWVFADRVEGELLESPPPRLVSGPVPRLEEAKEATSDLKDAIEKIYFSSAATEFELSRRVEPTWPNNANSLEAISCTSVGSAAVIPSASNPVIQAFSLLQQSPEVQTIVASLASDKSVWDAVTKNEKVVEFYKSHQTSFQTEDAEGNKDANELAESVLDYTEKPSDNSTESSSGIVQFINAIKLRVSKMVMDLSSFIQDFLETLLSNLRAARTQASDKNTNSMVAAPFVALAIAAIMIVLLKRA